MPSPRKRTVLAREEPTTEDGDLDVFVAASEDVANQSSVASDSCTGDSSDEVMSSDESDDDDDDDDDDSSDEHNSGSRIVHLPSLTRLLGSSCVCGNCKTGSLLVQESTRYDLAPILELTCDHCGHVFEGRLAEKHTPMRFYDVNRRSAMAMRMIGKGREALRMFCAIMDMPEPMYGRSFQSHCSALHDAAVEVGTNSMRHHAAELLAMRQASESDHPSHVAVSTDGTWMRRGYSSVFGAQTVIAYDTLKVADVEVLSKHCNHCKVWDNKRDTKTVTAAEFATWKAAHADSCDINTNVSSPAMETAAVVKIWNRSEALNGLRYTSYIGDGDSKGFQKGLCRQGQRDGRRYVLSWWFLSAKSCPFWGVPCDLWYTISPVWYVQIQ